MSVTVSLLAIRGTYIGTKYQTSVLRRLVLGRSSDCDIQLPDTPINLVVSRHHCTIEATTSGVLVRDMGSHNGTFLNGVALGRRPSGVAPGDGEFLSEGRPLHRGDELRIGDTVFAVEIGDDSADGSVATAERRKYDDLARPYQNREFVESLAQTYAVSTH